MRKKEGGREGGREIVRRRGGRKIRRKKRRKKGKKGGEGRARRKVTIEGVKKTNLHSRGTKGLTREEEESREEGGGAYTWY